MTDMYNNEHKIPPEVFTMLNYAEGSRLVVIEANDGNEWMFWNVSESEGRKDWEVTFRSEINSLRLVTCPVCNESAIRNIYRKVSCCDQTISSDPWDRSVFPPVFIGSELVEKVS